MTPLVPILTAARDKIANASFWDRYSAVEALSSTGALPLQVANIWTALRIASGHIELRQWFAGATHAETLAVFNTAIAQQSADTDADTMAVAHGSEDVF